MQLRELTFQRLEQEAASLGVTLPIEQTEAWSRLQETIDGRSLWGCFKLQDGERTVALLVLYDFATPRSGRCPAAPRQSRSRPPSTPSQATCAAATAGSSSSVWPWRPSSP